MHYGDLYLGKTTVLCKDTCIHCKPYRCVFGTMAIMNTMEKLKLTVDEIDALTGPVIGRPKSATFRTADVVGIDTLVKVGVYDNCPDDEAKEKFIIPAWQIKWSTTIGWEIKQGRAFQEVDGSKDIQVLNLETLQYEPRTKAKFATFWNRQTDWRPTYPFKSTLVAGQDKAGEFYRHFHFSLFSYISHRIPEISDEIYRVDDAMMAFSVGRDRCLWKVGIHSASQNPGSNESCRL